MNSFLTFIIAFSSIFNFSLIAGTDSVLNDYSPQVVRKAERLNVSSANVINVLNNVDSLKNGYFQLLKPTIVPAVGTILSLDKPYEDIETVSVTAEPPPPPECTDKEELIDNECVPLPEPEPEPEPEAKDEKVVEIPSINPSADIIELLNQIAPMNQIANYENGNVPSELLCSIPWSGSFQVYCPTLEPLKKLNDAYANEFGKNLSFASAYRAGFAGRSFHGWGMAIDLNGPNGLLNFNDAEYKWLFVNAPKFGWFHPMWAGVNGSNPEAWHWEFGSWYNDYNLADNYTSEIPPVIIRWIHH